MKRFWLIFAQAITIALGVWFLMAALFPEMRPRLKNFTTQKEGGTTPSSLDPQPVPGNVSYRAAVHRAIPSVVNIYTAKEGHHSKNPLLEDPFFRHFFGDQFGNDEEEQATLSLGSGVLVSSEGYIVTNNHVVESANKIEVALSDGRTTRAKIIGTDPDTDLAVIKISLDALPAIEFSNSAQLKIGDVVLAIGNPFGVGQTVTMGIVSALGRSNLHINTYENFIQTDAAINPGNSGGALIDTNGYLVGVNTAMYSSRFGRSLGIGFATPANTVKEVVAALIKYGSVIRGWLGAEPQNVTADLAASFMLGKARGGLIAGVRRYSPAHTAGLRPGDIVLKIDTTPIRDAAHMENFIAQLKPGQMVQMDVFRQGKVVLIHVKIGKRPTK